MPKINQKAILKQLARDISDIKAILSIPKEQPKLLHKLETITKSLLDGETFYCTCGYHTGRSGYLEDHITKENRKRE